MFKLVALIFLMTNPDPIMIEGTFKFASIEQCEEHIETAKKSLEATLGPILKNIASIKCINVKKPDISI